MHREIEPSKLKFRLGFNATVLASPKIRGITRHTLNLIDGIHRLAPNIEIFLFSNRELSPSLLKRIPFAKPRICSVHPSLLWEQAVLPLQLGWESIDIFHSTQNSGTPFFRPFYTSTVQTIHDISAHEAFLHLPETLAPQAWRKFLGFWPRWGAAMSADAMIAVSECSRGEVVERYPSLAGKIQIIPNAVDPVFRAGAADPEILSRFGLRGEYLLYVGGFEDRKNVGCLVEAYRAFRVRATEQGKTDIPQLVLIGGFDQVPGKLSQQIDATPGVISLAYCTDEVLLELYRGAVFGVFPSRVEGFGFPALEFGSIGTPAILSDIPIFHEIANEAAPYFDPEDSAALADLIWHMWRDPEWRASWARKLSNIAHGYSWDAIAKKTLGVYQSIMEH